jgi:hypothetical protein
MLTFTFECQNEAQFLALQRAAHFLAEMHQLAQAAPHGHILQTLEDHALDGGRQLLRDVLQSAAQQRIDHDEKKGGPHAAARASGRTDSRAGMAAT